MQSRRCEPDRRSPEEIYGEETAEAKFNGNRTDESRVALRLKIGYILIPMIPNPQTGDNVSISFRDCFVSKLAAL